MTLSKSDLNSVNDRLAKVGLDEVRKVEDEWPQIIAQVSQEMINGTDPSNARVKELADRWYKLLEAFTGGDQSIKDKLTSEYYNGKHKHMDRHSGPTPEMIEYISKAREAN